MLQQFNPEKHVKVFHKKYGTCFIIDREVSVEFMNAIKNKSFTCYRLGDNDWISTLKAYSFPKEELSLKPVQVAAK